MTIPEWPTSLPRPARGTYQAQLADGRISKTGGGPPGYRRRFSSVPRLVSLSINVPRSEKAVFDDFYEEQVGFGSLPFWMPDPATDNWPLLSSEGKAILDEVGRPILLAARWLVLFGQETPVETIKGVRFDISFSVAVMP